tara:strand:+ start:95 stop:658 length:564 start_codon:yes stop_codon:yes gene_type:complete
MEKILWSGEHLGAYLWDRKGRGAEVSLYKVVWSPEGTGTIAFIRFSAQTGLNTLDGIYTDKKKVLDYMTSYVFKKGKPSNNIVNVISFPVFNAVCERENNLPSSIVERIVVENNSIEICWHGLDDLKYYKPEKSEKLSVRYCYLAGKVDIAEIYVKRKLVLRSEFKSGSNVNSSIAFVGLSEIWFEN